MDDRGLAGHRLLEIDDCRQRIVRDDDHIGGIARHVSIFRHHHGNRLASEANRVDGDRAVLGRRERRADGHRAEELGDLLAGEDRLNAIHRLRRARIDRNDAAVRDVAPLERHVQHADERDVVNIGGAPLDETGILAALDALANELWQHWSNSHVYLFAVAACWMALTMC